MNYLLTFFILVTGNYLEINVSQDKCSCDDIKFEKDCLQVNGICNWNGTRCNSWDCSGIDKQECATANSCAWSKNRCEEFTKCEDYSTNDTLCEQQGTGCATANESYQLDNGLYVYGCTEGKQSTKKIGKCLTYQSNKTCVEDGVGCFWQGSYCRIRKCSDYQTNEECKRVYSDNYQILTICEWTESNICRQAESLETLDQDNCLNLTNRRATWDAITNKCNFCYPSFSIMIINLFLSGIFF